MTDQEKHESHHPEHHGHREHHVRLTVQTLSGNFTHEFNVHDHLKFVVDETFKHLHIVPAPGEVWELRYNGTVLNLDETIQQAHLPDGATLQLAPSESGGG